MSLLEVIKQRQEGFMAAFNAKNAKEVAEFYAPEGYVTPVDGHPIKGRDGIAGYFQKELDSGTHSVTILTDEVEGSGDLAYERGRYHMDGKSERASGVYVLIWKKINGEWLIYCDSFNVIP